MNSPHPSPRLLQSPAPGAKRSRTDQGVDWANVKKIAAVGPGVISKIYYGLQGFGTTVIEHLSGPSGGPTEDIYYGFETGGGTPTVHEGQQVQGGTEIAPGTGGAIEVGYWDTSTGRASGAPEFSGSNPTSAGQRFLAAIGGPDQASSGVTRPGGDTAGSGSSTSGGAGKILQAYQDLRDMPRSAPPSTKNPFAWWLTSFTGKWSGLASGAAAGAAAGAASAVGGGKSWQVRASAEEAASGSGWTELSTNGNGAAATGHARTATGSGGWDFATLGKQYPKGTQLKITDPNSGGSGVFGLSDYGDGSSFGPAIGLTPAVQQAIRWSGGDVIIELADGSDLSLASGFGTAK